MSSIQQMHTCLGSGEGQRGTNNSTKWHQRVLPELIVLKRNTKSQAIIEAVQLKYHVSVNQLSARRAKQALLGRSVAEFAHKYQQLPAYLARFSATNLFITYYLLIDLETRRFKRIFICLLVSGISFGHTHGTVAVDGTSLKGSFVHTPLLAVGSTRKDMLLSLHGRLLREKTSPPGSGFLLTVYSAAWAVERPVIILQHVESLLNYLLFICN